MKNNYKYCMPIAKVSFKTFIAWQMGRPLDEANNMDIDDEIKEWYFCSDPLIYDENGTAPSPDEFKSFWDRNCDVLIYEISIGPNGFHEISFAIDGSSFGQDFDLEYVSIPKLFEYALN